MTCKEQGCLNNTRNPNRAICWQNGKCPEHYWGKSIQRYRRKDMRKDNND